MIDLKVTPLADAKIVSDISSVVAVLGNHINDPSYRVRSVGGAPAVLQDFNPVDRPQRDGVDVDKAEDAIEGDRITGKSVAIDQNQGVVRRQSTKTIGGRSRRITGSGKSHGVLLAQAARIPGEHVIEGLIGLFRDEIPIQSKNRLRPLAHARNQVTGDGYLLQFSSSA